MKKHLKKGKTILSRKETRKNQRKEKKQRRLEYYTKRNKTQVPKNNKQPESQDSLYPMKLRTGNVTQSPSSKKMKSDPQPVKVLSTDDLRRKEIQAKKILDSQMKSQRKKQMFDANLQEDRTIKHLEKQLKLNKRKSKSIPKSFAADGLDYLLEVCDSEWNKGAVIAEKQLTGTGEDFEEDFFLMTGKQGDRGTGDEEESERSDSDVEDSNENEDTVDSDNGSIESDLSDTIQNKSNKRKHKQVSDNTTINIKRSKITEEKDNDTQDFCEDEEDIGERIEDETEEMSSISEVDDSEEIQEEMSNISEEDSVEIREDIYGRKRRKDGTIVEEPKGQKYIPPAIRARQETSDPKRNEKLKRLKKQLKGLLNRLAERNLHNISQQIENLYMNNSRHDVNDTITSLILEALVSPVNTPERLLMEHIVLVTVLHANVGTEVGAHFLQTVIKQFDTYMQESHKVENKCIDNLIRIIAQLYNFSMYDSKLLYEILDVLFKRFGEKEVECILHILKSVGFTLRKDNPLALKELIGNLQKKATNVPDDVKENSRTKFMLDVLLAIKNNNVNKIPNYDTSYSEHLKKIMKGFIRKGNYVSPLSITLEDLLKAEEKGKWWVVGSAWSGNSLEERVPLKRAPQQESYSQKLLELAKKQRMNTDIRRSIFCTIMSAEDYLDAFEKLLRLGLKNQQQREIINVLIHCALKEKTYNPYYSVLAQKFCESDRKYQMTIKYLVWDKLKTLEDHSASQISNLAKVLTHLFIEKSLPISALKIIQFSELDKLNVRFVRQVLLGILLHDDVDAVKEVFEKVGQADKLKMFRESLHLFICHFLLSNLKQGLIGDEQKTLLESRAKIVEQILTSKKEKYVF